MSQSQPLRIESTNFSSFGTAKTQNSRLWFVNNPKFENQALAYLAKYQEKYGVTLYAKVFQGNHFHITAHFGNFQRAGFYRDYNARLAELVRRHVPSFPGGALFGRRYSEQSLPLDSDIEDKFFYCALQPVAAGLCERISEYPGYNSFNDAVSGRIRKLELINWAGFNEAKRSGQFPRLKNYITYHYLRFSRLPGYEHLSQTEYKKLMYIKLEERRLEIVRRLKKQGHIFQCKEKLMKILPGMYPRTTKKSDRYSKRPLVLTSCAKTKRLFMEWYFDIYSRYKIAVAQYLAGDTSAVFPPGTYKPPGPFIPIPL